MNGPLTVPGRTDDVVPPERRWYGGTCRGGCEVWKMVVTPVGTRVSKEEESISSSSWELE